MSGGKRNLPKALAIPTLETIEINGMKMMPVLSSETISPKVIVVLSFSTEKGGGETSGKPFGTLPKTKKNILVLTGKSKLLECLLTLL